MAQIFQRVKKKQNNKQKNYECCKKTGEYCKKRCVAQHGHRKGRIQFFKSLNTTRIDKRYNYRPHNTT